MSNFAPNAIRTVAVLRNQPAMLAKEHVRVWLRDVLVMGPVDAAASVGSILEDRATAEDAYALRTGLRRLVRKHRRIQDTPGALAILYALARAEGRPVSWAYGVASGVAAL